ncbi:hypothetical protein BDN71DRAFT_1454592 [Pleurotus eryngii]|uniref:Uncharacterized protein n=1 Tax=Pleurotus eryngii TaxID=5323 RepID=A0A9P6DAY9_PLEER|nr:hypothetical protein BDN71DRAFT_1454592 [Pleurotus eryngii]
MTLSVGFVLPINGVPFQPQPHRARERGGIYSTTRIGFSNHKLSAQISKLKPSENAQGPYFPCRESCLKHSWARTSSTLDLA